MNPAINDDNEMLASLFAQALGAILTDGQAVMIEVKVDGAPEGAKDTRDFLIANYDEKIMVVALDDDSGYKQGDIIDNWSPEFFENSGLGALH